jgi:hypothetical protein
MASGAEAVPGLYDTVTSHGTGTSTKSLSSCENGKPKMPSPPAGEDGSNDLILSALVGLVVDIVTGD